VALAVPFLLLIVGGNPWHQAAEPAQRLVLVAAGLISAATAVAVKTQVDAARRMKALEGCGAVCGAWGKEAQAYVAGTNPKPQEATGSSCTCGGGEKIATKKAPAVSSPASGTGPTPPPVPETTAAPTPPTPDQAKP
jgi:hypothetical protein